MKGNLPVKRALVFFYDYNRERALRKKARKIIASCSKSEVFAQPSASAVKKYKAFWKGYSLNARTAWLRIYCNISGIWDHRYVPETIYYNRLEPCLNNKAFSKGHTDKNIYNLFLDDFDLPPTLISNIDGVFYDTEYKPVNQEQIFSYLENESRFIVKPAVDSGGGRKVTIWDKHNERFISNEGNILSHDYLVSVYKENYIIQKVIEQHSFYSHFNPASVNTIRVLTYRSVKDETIKILHCVLRVGKAGSITDNQASGGYACGLTESGELTGIAVDKMGNRFKKVNDADLIPGTGVEGFERILQTSRNLASRFYYARLLGLDLCIDNSGNVRVLEVNNVNNEINFFQMLYGPLFGSYTEEVVTWCSVHDRSFLIDFDI